MLKQCHHTFSQEAQFVSCTLFNKRCTLEKTVNLRRKYQMVLTLGVLFTDTPENMEKKFQNAFDFIRFCIALERNPAYTKSLKLCGF